MFLLIAAFKFFVEKMREFIKPVSNVNLWKNKCQEHKDDIHIFHFKPQNMTYFQLWIFHKNWATTLGYPLHSPIQSPLNRVVMNKKNILYNFKSKNTVFQS